VATFKHVICFGCISTRFLVALRLAGLRLRIRKAAGERASSKQKTIQQGSFVLRQVPDGIFPGPVLAYGVRTVWFLRKLDCIGRPTVVFGLQVSWNRAHVDCAPLRMLPPTDVASCTPSTAHLIALQINLPSLALRSFGDAVLLLLNSVVRFRKFIGA